jgi:glyoxylase-like metal-dependent hydrolase (beta-lactamase superfamily II)
VRIRQPGKIRDNLWYLGSEESAVYLLEGRDESILISGGMNYLVPIVLRQFSDFSIDTQRITKILILHAHFDHVGIVPFFKRSRPDLTVYASARAWERLGMPETIETINAFSNNALERMDMVEAFSAYDLTWRNDISGVMVSEGERIELGEMAVQIYETPGHSSCSISAYVPTMNVLFPSDAGGVPYKQTIITSGNSNYTQFQQSLEKLKDLEVDYLCADHYGYVTGDEARDFIARAIELAHEHRKKMEHLYRRTQDVNVAAKKMVNSIYAAHPDYFLSPHVLEGVYRQMVRHIAGCMEPAANPGSSTS